MSREPLGVVWGWRERVGCGGALEGYLKPWERVVGLEESGTAWRPRKRRLAGESRGGGQRGAVPQRAEVERLRGGEEEEEVVSSLPAPSPARPALLRRGGWSDRPWGP